MLYLDTIIKGYFQTTPDGDVVFYPWGALGPGYIVRGDAARQRIERLVKRALLAMAAVSVIPVALNWNVTGVLVLLAAFVVYSLWARTYLTRGLERSGARMQIKRALADQASGFSLISVWFLVLFSLAFAIIGVIIFVTDPTERPMAFACIALFAPATLFFAWMIKNRR